MGHHLVIDELVARGDLRGAVEHQHLAEVLLLEQHEVLVLGLLLVEHLVDREGHAEAEVVEQGLGDPALVGHRVPHSRSSCPRMRASSNRRGFIEARGFKWTNGLRILDRPPARAMTAQRAMRLTPLPAQVLADRDALRLERLAQHRDAGIRLGVAAHEDVERRVARLRPGVDRDVALGQHRDAGDPAVRLEVMQVDVQQRRARGGDAAAQRLVDQVDVVEAARPRRDRRSDARRRSARRCAPRSGPCAHRCRRNCRSCLTGATAGLAFFRAVPGVPKPLSDRKRAVWRMPSSPTRIEPRVPASRSLGKRMPPDRVQIGLIYSGKVPK